MSLSIIFDIPHTYYVPQYSPVIERLKDYGVQCSAMLYRGVDDRLKEKAASDLNIAIHWAENAEQAAKQYKELRPDWVIFGNDYHYLSLLSPETKTALLFHGSGTGVKSASLSPGLADFDVRFVSGPGRMKIFAERYPNVKLHEVGFAKLDPLRKQAQLEKIQLDLSSLGLNAAKPTLLYAPTFYPSSIENMPLSFPEDFSAYNILIKAHDFTLHKRKYRHQLKKLSHWSKRDNVYLAHEDEYSLVPFMASADLMMTDTSSAIFEFSSLNKPVVICDFPHLRWTYRGPFKYRLSKRLDESTRHYQSVAARAGKYSQLKALVDEHIQHPELLETTRLKYAREIMGKMDGNASQRICDILLREA